ncbi:hypothetical protein LB524_14105 [Mesorhizobium sp. ESP6-5]|uniref:Uncharacterized protein n=2 Tax=Mesorhizobium TaxID=68287 RepID=L0KN06_MESAW|nr:MULTISPECIES: hypothetical protein [Mesorhizobium]AGB45369.1 hypothetical protein Mesau_02988 [Mesorhizobium australicum WSM2073]MBZ9684372.1 hypothetical protein [Mesorhizobium sp. CO1-1-2]MBZ9723862.1 hypothetical protein [Mesorhizobium sp. CO1-1-11]MBZ9756426.1 hypothetical protein [Mesorhizobium sp. ESP6-5]MBZ9926690.1 hypothetical protein [Mesorhizobium sp. BR1-1-4]
MSHRATSIMAGLALLAFAVSPAAASNRMFTSQKTALSGRDVYFFGGASLNVDCSSAGRDDVRVVSGPSHGNVKLVHDGVFTHYNKSNDRAKCNSHKVNGIKALYRSSPGFKGWDQVTISVHTYDGDAFKYVTNIKVE